MLATLLALGIVIGVQAPMTPVSGQDLSVLVERVVRATELQRQKLDLERRIASLAALQLRVVEVQRTLGPEHPSRRTLETQLASLRERERALAVRQLASGTEADLLAAIDRDPVDPAPLIQLGGLYATAGRPDYAERVLSRAVSLLKGGRQVPSCE
jgi:hypothetical protein